jgi:thiol:disulfide interchange protein
MKSLVLRAALLSSALILPGCQPDEAERKTAAELTLRATNDLPARLTEAMARATSANRPIMLTFTAAWCGPCKVLDAETQTDGEFQREAANWECLKLDVEQHPELARRFLIEGLPTILLLEPGGNLLRIDRFTSVIDLRGRMNQFRAGRAGE